MYALSGLVLLGVMAITVGFKPLTDKRKVFMNLFAGGTFYLGIIMLKNVIF